MARSSRVGLWWELRGNWVSAVSVGGSRIFWTAWCVVWKIFEGEILWLTFTWRRKDSSNRHFQSNSSGPVWLASGHGVCPGLLMLIDMDTVLAKHGTPDCMARAGQQWLNVRAHFHDGISSDYRSGSGAVLCDCAVRAQVEWLSAHVPQQRLGCF